MKPNVSPDSIMPRGHEAKRVSIMDAAGEVFCRESFAGANID
ncbi:MAG: TetR/AcrR family transcriptional regulator, partial [Mesorhizobium sp.]